jgi:hypothetical protein
MGKLEQQREIILHTLQLRFPLSSEQAESIAERLDMIDSLQRLELLFDIALRAYTWGEFQSALDKMAANESTPLEKT